ncbi:SDR family oxidoreductase [Crateriforma conspicua]|uniref:Glucose 1-dehydrogenase 4 n=1 Tax=Crateriforma conspicua TaxID=2527996 RepID=A0A5C6G024_9PLAN|nr:SDR family oxidoreductase [Crateriforma conspicua]TWU66603.1 Glucose 1-dehydrogenase 4 [Crateriforma conspicua]
MNRRTAIVTGGSTGIGRATAIELAEYGHDVAITYRSSRDKAQETADAVEEAGGRCFIHQLDLSSPETAGPVVDQAVDQLGGLDVLVSNAGMMVRQTVPDLDLETARKIFDVNAIGAAMLIQRGVQHMVPDGDLSQARPTPGRVIVVTSVHETIANPQDTLYTMTKHALGGLVKCLALDLSPRNITVNAIAPGEVATPINGMDADDFDDVDRPAIPVRRAGAPKEIAAAVRFLASDDAGFVTGASWVVDGGLKVAAPLAASGFRKSYLQQG